MDRPSRHSKSPSNPRKHATKAMPELNAKLTSRRPFTNYVTGYPEATEK